MTLKAVLKTAEKFVVDNSPGILTGLAVAGTVTTAVLAGRASYSAALMLQYENMQRPEYSEIDGKFQNKLPSKEVVQLVWKEYIPAAIVLSATITSAIMANQIGARRAAAITAAFNLSERMANEYREKVIETLGKNNEEKVRANLAKDRIDKAVGTDVLVITGPETLFYDSWSGRCFKSDMETVRKAVNDINYQVNNDYYASLTEFYHKLGLTGTEISDDFGWNADQLLDVTYSVTMTDKQQPAISIDYNKAPIKGYDRCQ